MTAQLLSRTTQLACRILLLGAFLSTAQRARSEETRPSEEHSLPSKPGFSFGFSAGYRTVTGSRPFPLDYLKGALSSALEARYYLSHRTAVRLAVSFSGNTGKAEYLGTYIDDFNREVDVSIELPSFNTVSILLSLERDWPVGHDPRGDARIGLKVGIGIHEITGKATYLLAVFGQFLSERLLAYPMESSPMISLGATYAKNLSPIIRFETGADVAAFLATDPGFDEFASLQTRGKFVVMMPSIHAGLWFMLE